MSDTNTKKAKKPRRDRTRKRAGSLTLRILSVNVIAPLVLVVALLYLGQYRKGLIQAEIETLTMQAQLFAGAIAESAVKEAEPPNPFLPYAARQEETETLILDQAGRMVRRLGKTTDSRARLFDESGRLVSDSHRLADAGGIVQIVSLDPPVSYSGLTEALHYLGRKVIEILPTATDLAPYPRTTSENIAEYPDAARSLSEKKPNATAWEDENGNILLTAAAPIHKNEQVIGIVMLTRDGREIEIALAQVRFDVLTVFLGALSITIFLSIYLAGIIGRPLKKLADAAESVRQERGRRIDIPDLSHRRDEIGELSMALHDMTQALRDRMDTIERFAADVSHEIKNPLTSLRSAVETASRVRDRKDLDRLLTIIEHDVQRLDRLISDISNASRLDAELSRDEMGVVDINRLLQQLADGHKAPMERGLSENQETGNIKLEISNPDKLYVRGKESRLAQVFENLIANALSFSPPDGIVTIRAGRENEQVKIEIEDQGPGIPENKLESIFDRFYSERPRHEDYGTHSGLGLSIARQIIKAHGGQIYARNKAKEGTIQGALFTVKLNSIA